MEIRVQMKKARNLMTVRNNKINKINNQALNNYKNQLQKMIKNQEKLRVHYKLIKGKQNWISN